MKTILLCSDAPNQVALAAKLHDSIGLSGIVVQRKKSGKGGRKLSWRSLTRKFGNRLFAHQFVTVWDQIMSKYRTQFPGFPIEPDCVVDDINAPDAKEFVTESGPSLVLVSGTNLLRSPLIEAAQRSGAIMNLHTGISPYVKGGPNCTNWCLARAQPELIGNTIMWIDVGIDTGNLIATEQTRFLGDETLTELHFKVMEHAHDLYVRAAKRYSDGLELPNIPQSEYGSGETFYTRDWTPREAMRAIRYHRRHYAEAVRSKPKSKIRLVNLA